MPDHLTIQVRFEDGSLWATVDELPGVFATGDTLEELRESLQEGIRLYLTAPGEELPHLEIGPLSADPVTASVDLVSA
jgi:predicted RNase H-like HicB family nuclease